MSGLLSLKWNNHTSVFLNLLQTLRNKELYCDTTIVCQGCFYPVHRLVLSSCSEYFEEIFKRAQCKHPFIILKDIEPADLEFLLSYMYKGEVNVVQEALPGLIKAAEALKIKGLAVPDESPPVSEISAKERKRPSSSSSSYSSKPKRSHIVEDKTHHSSENRRSKNISGMAELLSNRLNSDSDYIRDSLVENSYSSHCNDRSTFKTSSKHRDGNLDKENDSERTFIPHEVCVKSEPSTAIEDNSDFNSPEETMAYKSPQADDTNVFKPNLVTDSDSLPPSSFLNQSYEDGNGGPSGINEVCIKSEPSTAVDDSSLDFNAEDENISYDSLPENNEMLQSNELTETDSLPPTSFQSYQEGVEGPSGITKESQDTWMVSHLKSHSLSTVRRAEKRKSVGLCNSSSLEPSAAFKFNCSYCSYGSEYSSHVKRHEMRKHTGIKPYICNQCPYSSVTNDGLRLHAQRHTGERPYKCQFCPHRCSVRADLKKHTKIHFLSN